MRTLITRMLCTAMRILGPHASSSIQTSVIAVLGMTRMESHSVACRATKTLVYYLMETNLNLHYWLSAFLSAHPIPRVSRMNPSACHRMFKRSVLLDSASSLRCEAARQGASFHLLPALQRDDFCLTTPVDISICLSCVQEVN